MFKKWLEMRLDASWGQLIEVLKLNLKTAANRVTTCFAVVSKAGTVAIVMLYS